MAELKTSHERELHFLRDANVTLSVQVDDLNKSVNKQSDQRSRRNGSIKRNLSITVSNADSDEDSIGQVQQRFETDEEEQKLAPESSFANENSIRRFDSSSYSEIGKTITEKSFGGSSVRKFDSESESDDESENVLAGPGSVRKFDSGSSLNTDSDWQSDEVQQVEFDSSDNSDSVGQGSVKRFESSEGSNSGSAAVR